MIRWLLGGLLLLGVATGLSRGWIVLDTCRMLRDLNVPTIQDLQKDAAPVCPSDR